MARLARVVVPELPHHLTQRGNRRQSAEGGFFRQDDYHAYLELMGEWCARCGMAVWAYCLMPNHVYLLAAPKSEDGLQRTQLNRAATVRERFLSLAGAPVARAVRLVRNG